LVIDKNEARAMDYHIAIYNKYIALSQKFPKRIKVIEANRSVEDISLAVIDQVQKIEISK